MRILTHHAPNCPEAPWCAVDMDRAMVILEGYPLTDAERTELPALMAGYCRLLEDADAIGYGQTEADAITGAGHAYKVERDVHGYAIAISLGGIWMIHLDAGTVRNEENIDNLVGRLNRKTR